MFINIFFLNACNENIKSFTTLIKFDRMETLIEHFYLRGLFNKDNFKLWDEFFEKRNFKFICKRFFRRMKEQSYTIFLNCLYDKDQLDVFFKYLLKEENFLIFIKNKKCLYFLYAIFKNKTFFDMFVEQINQKHAKLIFKEVFKAGHMLHKSLDKFLLTDQDNIDQNVFILCKILSKFNLIEEAFKFLNIEHSKKKLNRYIIFDLNLTKTGQMLKNSIIKISQSEDKDLQKVFNFLIKTYDPSINKTYHYPADIFIYLPNLCRALSFSKEEINNFLKLNYLSKESKQKLKDMQ